MRALFLKGGRSASPKKEASLSDPPAANRPAFTWPHNILAKAYFCSYRTVRTMPVYVNQGVTIKRRLSWLTNSALVYEPKCGGGGVAGSQTMSTAVHKSQNKL
jgi:hypothetical protein